jgi:hypothetical protein
MQELDTLTELRDIVFFDLKGKTYYRLYIEKGEDIHISLLDIDIPDRKELMLKDKRFAEHLIKYYGNRMEYLEDVTQHSLRDSELKADLEKAINQWLMYMLY